MDGLSRQLFEGEKVRLTAFQPDKDSEIESRWTRDPEFWHFAGPKPARPLSAAQVKKNREKLAGEAKERPNRFDFAVRLRSDNCLIGFAQLDSVEWNHGHAWMRVAIGDPADRGQGCGSQALRLLLRYAFHELNLFRLTTNVYEYDSRGLRFLERHGFAVEVRRRQAIHRLGRRWDDLRLGLLKEAWEKKGKERNE
ncbi:MAG: GNAT family N-acetyltransferase [Chloroflexi bacterium]|nr:GNAT family N-acetyltransferase [Chloroflexota bacterium]